MEAGGAGQALALQGERQQGRDRERSAHPGHAGMPAECVEQPAKDGRADQPAAEIAGEIGAAGDAAVFSRSLTYESCRSGLRGKGADADQNHPGEYLAQVWDEAAARFRLLTENTEPE